MDNIEGLEIMGKTIQIRHATEADLTFIEQQLDRNNMLSRNLDYREFVVAVENMDIVGFGRLRKAGDVYQIGCVVVIEDKRNRGVGSLIIKHLVTFSPLNLVYVPKDLVGYFGNLGFEEMKEESKELLDALDEACGFKGQPDTVIMVHEKK